MKKLTDTQKILAGAALLVALVYWFVIRKKPIPGTHSERCTNRNKNYSFAELCVPNSDYLDTLSERIYRMSGLDFLGNNDLILAELSTLSDQELKYLATEYQYVVGNPFATGYLKHKVNSINFKNTARKQQVIVKMQLLGI